MGEWYLLRSVYSGHLVHHPVTTTWPFVQTGTPGGLYICPKDSSKNIKQSHFVHQFAEKRLEAGFGILNLHRRNQI